MNSNWLIISALLVILPHFIESGCPRIIKRSEWNARAPKVPPRPLSRNPAPFIVVHHSDGPTCTTEESCKSRIKGIQNYHMDHNGWQDIGYTFLIGGDGNVYEGRGWGTNGAHVPKYNSKSVGICMIGNFMEKLPDDVQLNALKDLIACASETNRVVPNYDLIGHRQGGRTDCPGDKLYEEIKTWPRFDNKISPV